MSCHLVYEHLHNETVDYFVHQLVLNILCKPFVQ